MHLICYVNRSVEMVVGHCAQSYCSLGSDTKHSGEVIGGEVLLRIGSWLVGKLANKMLYHLLQCECTDVQVLSLWIKVRKYEKI